MRDELGRNADLFLHNNHLGDEGWAFEFFYPHPVTTSTGPAVLEFRFVCDGSHRPAGVIRVRYVDYIVIELPSA